MSKFAPSLFWVSSEQKKTNWLVFADCLKTALEFHNRQTGSKVIRGSSFHVLGNPPFPIKPMSSPVYASLDDLRALGFHIVREQQPRAVRLGSAWFVEGDRRDEVPEWVEYFGEFIEKGSLAKLL